MSGVEVLTLLGLGLAVPGVIDVFIRVGQGVASKISDDKKAKAYASNLHVFVVPSAIDRMQLHMRQAQNLLKDPTVEEADKDRLMRIFDVIKSTLKLTDDCANIVTSRHTFSKKRRQALQTLKTETAHLRELLDDFRDRVIALKDIAASDSNLFLTEHDFQWIYSNAPRQTLNPNTFIRKGRVSQNLRSGKKSEVRWFLYENKPYTARNKTIVESNMRVLSQKLDAAEKGSSGILPILGFRDETDEEAFQVLFIAPNVEQRPQTLLSVLETVEEMPSLNTRIDICLQLAEALLHVHNVRLVHKSIRPDNVVTLGPLDNDKKSTDDADERPKLRVFLLGWHLARPADDFDTRREGEELWQRRIYQHPQRQRREAEADYNMGHDIYSFGACMLEILRWDALVIQRQSEVGTLTPDLSPDFAQTFENLNLHNEHRTQPLDMSDMDWILREPQNVQKVLLALNDKHLPRLVGTRLTTLVSDCLTRLDTNSSNAESASFNTDSQREIGNGFVDCVLKPLREVSHALGV